MIVQTNNGPATLDIHCPNPEETGFAWLFNFMGERADLKTLDGKDLSDPSMEAALSMEMDLLGGLNRKLKESGIAEIPTEGERPTSCALPAPTSGRLGL